MTTVFCKSKMKLAKQFHLKITQREVFVLWSRQKSEAGSFGQSFKMQRRSLRTRGGSDFQDCWFTLCSPLKYCFTLIISANQFKFPDYKFFRSKMTIRLYCSLRNPLLKRVLLFGREENVSVHIITLPPILWIQRLVMFWRLVVKSQNSFQVGISFENKI